MLRGAGILLGGVLALAGALASLEDQFHVQRWTVENGLPQNGIECLLQTQDGYLWIGTKAGLVRYDGRQFRVFHRANTPELRSDGIISLTETPEGTLWIGTGHGVVSYREGIWNRFENPAGLPQNRIFRLTPCRDGGMWVGTGWGLFLLHDGLWDLQPDEDGGAWKRPVSGIIEGKDGRVWVGDHFGLLEWSRGKGKIHWCARMGDGMAHQGVNFLVANEKDELWFSDYNHIYRWHNETLDQWPHPKPGWIPTLAVRAEGGLWLALPELGLGWFHHDEFHFYGAPDGIRPEPYTCLLSDHDGCLWLGTGRQGLLRLRPRQLLTYTTANGLTNDDVWSVSEAPDGSVWVGTSDGASRWNEGRWEKFEYRHPDGSSNPTLLALLRVFNAADGKVWASGEHLRRLVQGQFVPEPLLPTNRTNPRGWYHPGPSAYSQGRDGTLWFGSGAGLLVGSGTNWVSWSLDAPPGFGDVLGILEDAAGDLWVGGSQGRVDRLRRRPGFDFLALKADMERHPTSWTNSSSRSR